jgi:hypothetical protein
MACVSTAPPGLSGFAPAERFNKVLYDERAPAALAFAAEARRLGADVHAVRGDVTGVWFTALQPEWQASRISTAGLTCFKSWFVLDMMARDAGMRTVYLGHHESTPQGYAHRQFGPHSLSKASLDPTGQWGRQSARILMRFPRNVSVARDQSSILEARDCEISNASLVSWIIARPDTYRS